MYVLTLARIPEAGGGMRRWYRTSRTSQKHEQQQENRALLDAHVIIHY